MAEQEPLADGGAGGRGLAGVLDRLDALGDDQGVGPLGLGPDGVDDMGRLGGRPALEQAHVQLDQVGADEGQHGQAGRRGADVVEGDAPAGPAGLGDGGQQPGRVAGHGPLGHLDDHPQAVLAELDGRTQIVGAGDAEGDRLGVDEQGQGWDQPAAAGLGEGGRPADPVQLGHPTRPPGRPEQGRGRLQGRPHRPPGQGLVAEDVAALQVDEGLEQRLHGPLVEDPEEVLHRRREGVGDSRRTHGDLIDHRPAQVEPPEQGAR